MAYTLYEMASLWPRDPKTRPSSKRQSVKPVTVQGAARPKAPSWCDYVPWRVTAAACVGFVGFVGGSVDWVDCVYGSVCVLRYWLWSSWEWLWYALTCQEVARGVAPGAISVTEPNMGCCYFARETTSAFTKPCDRAAGAKTSAQVRKMGGWR